MSGSSSTMRIIFTRGHSLRGCSSWCALCIDHLLGLDKDYQGSDSSFLEPRSPSTEQDLDGFLPIVLFIFQAQEGVGLVNKEHPPPLA